MFLVVSKAIISNFFAAIFGISQAKLVCRTLCAAHLHTPHHLINRYYSRFFVQVGHKTTYRKVASVNMSQLEKRSRFYTYRLLKKGKFDMSIYCERLRKSCFPN